MYDRAATISPGRVTRVTELTITGGTIQVSHRTINPCAGSHPVARLAEVDRLHERRVIEMVGEAVRSHGDRWYAVLPGMIETTLGVWLDSDMVWAWKSRMQARYGHPRTSD
jgi:hypothetical protein